MSRFRLRSLAPATTAARRLQRSEAQRPTGDDLQAVRCIRQRWWAAAFALLIAGSFAGWHLARWPDRLRYPGDGNVGGDSMPLVETVHLRQGIPIYALASAQQYDGANWGPLFYLLGARLVNAQNPSYLPLRLLAMAGTLGCAAGAALLAFWFARSYFAAALASLIFLAYGFVTQHGVSARPDTVALLLCLAGFLVVYRSRNSRVLLLAIPLFLVSFFYKQQLVACPAAVLIFLLWEKRYRLAAEFAGYFALGVTGLLFFFQFGVFSGQAFLHHFLLYNLLPLNASGLIPGVEFFVLILPVPILVGLQSLREQPDRLLSCYLSVSVLLSVLTVARVGSDTYYFYESVLILSVLFAGLVAKRLRDLSRVSELLVLLAISLFLGQWFTVSQPQESDFAREQTIQNFLKQNFAPGTAALGYYSGDLLRAGLETPLSNIFHYTALVRTGALPAGDLPAAIQNHRFGVVVLNFHLRPDRDDYWANFYLSKSARDSILENYRLETVLEMPEVQRLQPDDRWYLWVPRT